jgi:integrase
MNRAYLDAMQSLTKRAKGDYSPDMVIGRFPEAPRPESKAAKAAATLTGIFALWEREHLANGKSRKTAADFRQKIGSLREFVGHDDADRVTPEDVIAWSDKLRFENGLSARTVSSKYLVAVKTVFGLACQRKAMRSNPAKDFSIKVPKALRTRSKGFTDTEASAILSAALADPSSFGKKSAHLRMAIRWAPWICAHTGARVGEITQLRREDFLSEHGVLCIRITPEAGSVKTGNFRLVPLHPCLVEQGFPEFVQSRPEGPLFFQSKGEHDPKIRAGNMAKKVGEWVREEVGIRDLKVQPNYGWRHRFKTLARDAGIPPEYIDAIQGHEDGRASTGYGETTVKALRREIERFPRQG